MKLTALLGPGATALHVLALSFTLAYPCVSHAESLPDAIASAYQSNPSIQSQRYQLRSLDEADAQALAGFRPTAEMNITADYSKTTLGPHNKAVQRLSNVNAPEFTESYPGQGQIILNQPVYTGGRVSSEVRAADADVLAGRQSLRATEGDVILAVIQAYASVIRDQAALDIHRTNLEALVKQLEETAARQRAGEVTRTDVEQAKAQLEAERALYTSAQAQLEASRLAYATAVGDNPGQLDPLPELPGVPANVDQAFDTATAEAPEVVQARLAEDSAQARVAAARAANRPTISLRASYGYTGPVEPYATRDFDRNLTAEAVITQPLFTGGVNSSLIHQALDQAVVARIQIEQARRTAVQNVANAWNQMLTSGANIKTQEAQVTAAQITYTGMTKEYRVGQRSTLDVLIAEETLRDAELSLVAARHDAYLGEASVLRYMGRLEVRALLVGQPLYDASINTRRARNRGATPWEGAIHRLDALGAPGVGHENVDNPAEPSIAPGVARGTPLDLAAPLAVAIPITPVH